MAVYRFDDSSTECSSEVINSTLISDDAVSNDIINISILNNVINEHVNINDEIPIEVDNCPNINIKSEDFFKDALLLQLYNQVEFLRKELEQKNELINTLVINNTKASKVHSKSLCSK